METLWLETGVGRVEAWYLAPLRDELGTPAPLLLLAHGNGDLIDYWLPSVNLIYDMGNDWMLRFAVAKAGGDL